MSARRNWEISDHQLQKFKEFIGQHDHIQNYLHNTPEKKFAEIIIKEGFRFEGYIDYTTDNISGYDEVELKYFLQTRARYGQYTIVIQIHEDIVNDYSDKLKETKCHFSEALAIEKAQGPDEDPIYTLAPHFIKGYFDQVNQKAISNPNFEPNKRLNVFDDNVINLINQ